MQPQRLLGVVSDPHEFLVLDLPVRGHGSGASFLSTLSTVRAVKVVKAVKVAEAVTVAEAVKVFRR
ncbi:hypothetical protein GCM10010448_66550 [Streptomyces glomeratus]|uniref:Protein kinase domain-containing protein n=1 Tax=Streptomyces glomeratus TaxID=284452 RepID=A0ABP6M6V7_9ACTN